MGGFIFMACSNNQTSEGAALQIVASGCFWVFKCPLLYASCIMCIKTGQL